MNFSEKCLFLGRDVQGTIRKLVLNLQKECPYDTNNFSFSLPDNTTCQVINHFIHCLVYYHIYMFSISGLYLARSCHMLYPIWIADSKSI